MTACDVAECERVHYAKGYCLRHYRNWRNHGDPLVQAHLRGASAEARFLSHVNKNGPVATNCPHLGRCWLWTGNRTKPYGYGRFRWEDGIDRGAHIWAYTHWVGPVPDGLQLDHFACDNTACVKPDHVRPVSAWENVLRSSSFAAANRAKTHCLNDHPLTGDNLYVNPASGERVCRTCAKAYRARWEEKQRVFHDTLGGL
jgi:hypothetical protein